MKLIEDVLDRYMSQGGRRKGTRDKRLHCTAGRSDAGRGLDVSGVRGGREGTPDGLGALIAHRQINRLPYSRRRGEQTIILALCGHGLSFCFLEGMRE